MELITISAQDFLKVISASCGDLEEICLEWEQLETACQNLFNKKDSHVFLRKASRVQTTTTGIRFERLLFDRYEDSWQQIVQEKFEKHLGVAQLLRKDDVEYELFRFWAAGNELKKENGFPTGKNIFLEYIGQKK